MDRIKIKNLRLKIIALICAIILWIYVVGQGQVSGSESNIVPLNYYNQTTGLQVSGPETVRVTVWGNQQKLGSNTEVTAYVDLDGLTEGVYELPVQLMPVKGTIVMKVEPDEVQVTVGAASKKSLEISYEVMTWPASGYELQNVLFLPENCVVKGSDEILSQINRVVAQLYLSNVSGIQEQKVRLLAVNESGEAVVDGVSIVPSEVDATILVEEIRSEKMVPVTVDVSGQPAEGCEIESVSVSPEQVQIFGSYNQIQSIDEIVLDSIVLRGQSNSFSQILPLPANENLMIYPSEIQVKVQISSVEVPLITEPEEAEAEEENQSAGIAEEPIEEPSETIVEETDNETEEINEVDGEADEFVEEE